MERAVDGKAVVTFATSNCMFTVPLLHAFRAKRGSTGWEGFLFAVGPRARTWAHGEPVHARSACNQPMHAALRIVMFCDLTFGQLRLAVSRLHNLDQRSTWFSAQKSKKGGSETTSEAVFARLMIFVVPEDKDLNPWPPHTLLSAHATVADCWFCTLVPAMSKNDAYNG
jgi:hypothetical protein